MIRMRLFHMSGTIQRVVHRMYYTKFGSTAVSVLFGLALAFMFQRVCKDRKCIVYHAPPMKEIESSVYKVKPDECYKYTTTVVPCAATA